MVKNLIVGIVLALIGLWLLLPLQLGYMSGIGWQPFLTVLAGTVPALLVLIGALMAWTEAEEMCTSAPQNPSDVSKRKRGRPKKGG